jgi:RsiW-degrading membrane proteinase PrsW (M82 family)
MKNQSVFYYYQLLLGCHCKVSFTAYNFYIFIFLAVTTYNQQFKGVCCNNLCKAFFVVGFSEKLNKYLIVFLFA